MESLAEGRSLVTVGPDGGGYREPSYPCLYLNSIEHPKITAHIYDAYNSGDEIILRVKCKVHKKTESDSEKEPDKKCIELDMLAMEMATAKEYQEFLHTMGEE